MSKTTRILLAILLAGASLLSVAAAHAPPAPEVPPEPVPSRSLFIVAQDGEAYAQDEEYADHQDDLDLALSADTNDTLEERRSYYWNEYNLGPICMPYSCGQFYGAKGLLLNIGEDFRLAPTQDISGVLDLEYSYSENSFMGQDDRIGAIHFGLMIGNASFEAQPIELLQSESYEPKLHNLTFHFVARCDYETHDEDGEHPPCDESFDNWTEEVWAHDLAMWMYIELPRQDMLSFGRYFNMGIGTNGTSRLDLPIFVPPAAVSALAVDESAIVSIAHDDLDEDGNVAEPVAVGDDVYYVPSVTLPLVLFATAALAVLIRRRV